KYHCSRSGLSSLAFVLLLLCAWRAAPAGAQSPACPATLGSGPCVPALPVQPPRPPSGPESVPAFVDSLTSIDSIFEVVVGQGRILTTKEALGVAGKPPALIAVGDPSVIDFRAVGPRQIRVVGMRVGVTDLSITTGDGRTYSFEVRVVADLHVLRGQLACLFPDARLKLAQIRDNIVVEGQARDTAQVGRILETIRAYLRSVTIGQLARVVGRSLPGTPKESPKEEQPGKGKPPETVLP